MSKHTPAPWAKNQYGELKGPNGKDIGVWGFGVSHVTRSEEAEANAVLLETAPELKDDLHNLVLLYEADEGCRSMPEYIAAIAALNKATSISN